MCTIIGATVAINRIRYKKANELIDYVYKTLPIRGRDGFGCEFIVNGERFKEYSIRRKNFDDFMDTFKSYYYDILDNYTGFMNVLLQARAIPETEEDLDLSEYQPVVYSKYAICHNGLIYNDKELAAKYGYKDIIYDSQIIPRLLESKYKSNQSIYDQLLSVHNELQGSFSIIGTKFDISSNNNPTYKGLFFLVNYQPLYYFKDRSIMVLTNIKPYDRQHMEIEPYSVGLATFDNVKIKQVI